jgi:predicted nucleic acid-binding protein
MPGAVRVGGRSFIDTNVLAYRFDDGEVDKQATARRRLHEERDAGVELVVSTQVLQELYVCLTGGKKPIASPEIAEAAVHEAATLSVVQIDPPLIAEAIRESRKSMISFWDALIVRAALASGCSRLLSEDLNDGQAFGALVVENPFAGVKAKARKK